MTSERQKYFAVTQYQKPLCSLQQLSTQTECALTVHFELKESVTYKNCVSQPLDETKRRVKGRQKWFHFIMMKKILFRCPQPPIF